MRRYLKLRNRANRLIAKRDRRRAPRRVHTAKQAQWSNRALLRAIRVPAQADPERAGRPARPARRADARRAGGPEPDRDCESGGNPRAIGGGGAFRGKYQFSFGTWASVGGRGDPAAAPEREQDRRAAMLLNRSGAWPWPVCG